MTSILRAQKLRLMRLGDNSPLPSPPGIAMPGDTSNSEPSAGAFVGMLGLMGLLQIAGYVLPVLLVLRILNGSGGSKQRSR
ncbi:MAG: hypothetical protein ACJ71W_05950 [Terriglobales bacterium]